MQNTSLAGRSILVVEDEPLIALAIANAFEGAGAQVKSAHTLADAKHLVEVDGLSAAVLDFGLRDGDADPLVDRLTARGIPFLLHSGYAHVGDAYRAGIVVPKPADPSALVDTLARALGVLG
jgi:DNA-binding NtrC family response regulator